MPPKRRSGRIKQDKNSGLPDKQSDAAAELKREVFYADGGKKVPSL
jgi:hypothetical protein